MLTEESRVNKSRLMFAILYVLHASITSTHAADCNTFGVCGPFGSCNINDSPICECLDGFEPTSPDQWSVADWSQGCRRTVRLNCDPGEGFNKYSNLKLPNTRNSWYNQTMTLVECDKMCKSNCSCTAYAYTDLGGGCSLWFGNLFDINTADEFGFRNTLYIRMPPSELDSKEKGRNSSVGGSPSNRSFPNSQMNNFQYRSVGEIRSGRRVRVIVPLTCVVLALLVSKGLLYRLNRKRQQQQGTPVNMFGHDPEFGSGDKDIRIKLFCLSTLHKATDNFSMGNKLGEGGFGPVYKGVLEDGQVIAVKRLAKTSTQGLHEFKNEVISISKLQHRNLVKLLGYCIEGAEKMLIYEYMSNKSLDSFLFDETQCELLNWTTRYHIINRVACGLLYLHQDSRLRIIHRDLKVSNILLDSNMNPKISDFGMARSFGGDQIEANTNRVVGTYGYMAPEYALHGVFSIKSDVYSFGVLVLEIVCGEKTRVFVCKERCNSLTGHAWELHNEGRSLQLAAKCLGESINVPQVIRSIHIGLLCVQHNPQDRPTMTSVITMLGSEGPLPSPKEPAFYIGKTKEETTQSSSLYGTCSNNELSISMLNGR